MTRFNMRLDPVWRPLLFPLGGTPPNSYVELTDTDITFKFGLGFERTVPRSNVAGVERRAWQWWMGIGWRTNMRGLIGLIGSYEGVVEVRLRERIRSWAGMFPCERIAVSLEDPDGFIKALSAHAPGEQPRNGAGRKTGAGRQRRKKAQG